MKLRILWTLMTSAIRFWYWLRPLLPWRNGRITIAWNANDQAEAVLGYIVQWGTAPGVYKKSRDVGNLLQCTILGLWPGRRYYIAVRAYDAWRPIVGQSLPSSEVSGTATRQRPTAVTAALIFSLLLFSSTALFAQSSVLSPGGGNALVTAGDLDGWATLVAFDFNDGINQIDVARFPAWVDARQTVPLSVGFQRDPCKTYQVDVFWGLAPAGRYTMSDVGNVRLLASMLLPAVSPCRLPPDEPPPPPQPPPEPACVSRTFTFGGSPTIARFPDGYLNPWYPEEIGPFYFYVPVAVYDITVVSGDNHVGDGPPPGKNDGPQWREILEFLFQNGWLLGPTDDVPDDKNSVVTHFWRRAMISPITSFIVRSAAPLNPPVPTNSVFPISITFTCVEDGQ